MHHSPLTTIYKRKTVCMRGNKQRPSSDFLIVIPESAWGEEKSREKKKKKKKCSRVAEIQVYELFTQSAKSGSK